MIAFEVVRSGCIWLYCQGDADSSVVGCDGKKSQGLELNSWVNDGALCCHGQP